MAKRQRSEEVGQDSSLSRRSMRKKPKVANSDNEDDDQASSRQSNFPSEQLSNIQQHSTACGAKKASKQTKSSKDGMKKRNSGPKSKNRLRQEGVAARKEQKAAKTQIAITEQELENAQKQLEECRDRVTELQKEKNDTMNKMKSLVIDDESIRRELNDLFTDCRDWAANYGRKDAMTDYLDPTQVRELLFSANEAARELGHCFLSSDGALMIQNIRGGGQLLLEGMLIHMIVDEVLTEPLLPFNLQIRPELKHISYGQVLGEFTAIASKSSPDSARLFHAHCVRIIASLTSVLEIQQHAAIRYDRFHALIKERFMPSVRCLLNDTFASDEKDILEELSDCFIEAGRISTKIWSCDVYVTTWGNNVAALRHRHRAGDNIKYHPTMQARAGDKNHFGAKFHAFTQPAIYCRDIAGESIPKLWSPAVGIIFNHTHGDIEAASHLETHESQAKLSATPMMPPVHVEPRLSSLMASSQGTKYEIIYGVEYGQNADYERRTPDLPVPHQNAQETRPGVLTGIEKFAAEPSIDARNPAHGESYTVKTTFCSAVPEIEKSESRFDLGEARFNGEKSPHEKAPLDSQTGSSKVCTENASGIIDLTSDDNHHEEYREPEEKADVNPIDDVATGLEPSQKDSSSIFAPLRGYETDGADYIRTTVKVPEGDQSGTIQERGLCLPSACHDHTTP